MDEARRRAWHALGIGPAWSLRDEAPRDRNEPLHDRVEAHDGTAPTHSSVPVGGADPRAAIAPAHRDAAPVEAAEPIGSGPGDAAEPIGDAAVDDPVALAASDVAAARRDPIVASLPWPALQQAVSGCTACGLCRSRRNTVFGVGPRPASWMLVGEAPGEQEDERGEPFVGPAGRLLDQMLEAVGVDRPRDAFIANVLKCRPPGNRNPTPEEVGRCEPYLIRQVELLQPRLIVVLGRFAAQSLLRTDATIASLRGRVHRYRAADRDVPLVVTYHPAYLLRTLPDKAKAWSDLRLARRTWDAAGEVSAAPGR